MLCALPLTFPHDIPHYLVSCLQPMVAHDSFILEKLPCTTITMYCLLYAPSQSHYFALYGYWLLPYTYFLNSNLLYHLLMFLLFGKRWSIHFVNFDIVIYCVCNVQLTSILCFLLFTLQVFNISFFFIHVLLFFCFVSIFFLFLFFLCNILFFIMWWCILLDYFMRMGVGYTMFIWEMDLSII